MLDKGQKFRDYLTGLEGKRVQVSVEKITRKRSLSQNKYYHAVVVKLIAEHTGHDPEQIHELLKFRFSPRSEMSLSGTQSATNIPTSTTRLDTIAFVEYTEKCRMWANEFLGLQIPLPGEITF